MLRVLFNSKMMNDYSFDQVRMASEGELQSQNEFGKFVGHFRKKKIRTKYRNMNGQFAIILFIAFRCIKQE